MVLSRFKRLIISDDDDTPPKVEKNQLEDTQSCLISVKKEETPGAKANNNGHRFEKKVSLTNALVSDGYTKKQIGSNTLRTYLYKEVIESDGKVTKYYFFKQRFLSHYLVQNHPGFKKLKKIPDEALLIERDNIRVLNIIEIKWQQVNGSVDEKIYSASALKEIYQYIFKEFATVNLCYVLSPFLIKKYENDELFMNVIKPILDRNLIPYFNQEQLFNVKEFSTRF